MTRPSAAELALVKGQRHDDHGNTQSNECARCGHGHRTRTAPAQGRQHADHNEDEECSGSDNSHLHIEPKVSIVRV